MPRYTANGKKLMHKVDSTYTEIPLLMEVPEFGGTPEKNRRYRAWRYR